MNSKRHEIAAAVTAAALAAAEAVSPKIRAYRTRVTPIERSKKPAILVQPIDDKPFANAGNDTPRALRISVSVAAWGYSGIELDEITDPIVVAVHVAILEDQSLGGLALSIDDDGAAWAYEDGDGGLAGEVTTVYTINYRAPVGALT